MVRRIRTLSLLFSLAILAAGCGSTAASNESVLPSTSASSTAAEDSPAPSTDASQSADASQSTEPSEAGGIDELVAAAKAEGTLTYYTVNTEAAAAEQSKAFEAKYGISVERVRLTGGELDARFPAEVNSAAGTPADIIFTTTPTLIRDSMTSGALVSLADANIPGYPWDYPQQFLQPDLGSALTLIEPTGIAYNTDLVKGSDVPTGWSNLVDAKWKDQVGIADPTGSLGYIGEWMVISKQEGGDYLTQLGDQNLKTYSASSELVGALGAGEISLAGAVLSSHVVAAKAKGAPVDYVVPDNTSGIQTYVGLVAKSAHPNAAKLFAMYAMSQEGIKVLADASHAVSPYDTAKLPKEYEGADIEGAPAVSDDVVAQLKLG